MPQSGTMRWRAAGAALLALALGGCRQAQDTLDEEALAREVRNMASLSAEAAFLCDELRAGHLKPSFVAVHLRDLARDAAKAQQQVARPAAPLLDQQQEQAQALADRLTRSLRDMALAQAGPDERLEGEQHALLRLKTELESLEKAL
jgi:hypothetical protein